jgi:pimeloyl-ACP methyl ester carboxylesterase
MIRLFCILLLIVLPSGILNAQDIEPPGSLVSVNDHQLHLDCQGEGQPAVIIEAGLASWSIHWRMVQTGIANFTRVCTYDRAGYGWSETGPEPRMVERLTDELAQLLETAEIDTPYILVGHSFGGLIAQAFYAQYPDSVVGLVLIDSPNPNAETPLPDGWLEANAALYENFPQFAAFAELGLITPESIEVPPAYPKDIYALYQQQLATPAFFNTAYSEMMHLEEGLETVDILVDDFGDLALTVILPIASQPAEENNELDSELAAAADAANISQQEELAALSTRGNLIRAEDSSHDTVQFEQPEIIVEAVRSIWEEVE